MLYRFTKKIHKITAFAGLLLFVFAAGASDRCIEFGQAQPENLDSLIAWGFALMIPTAIYLILDYARGKRNALHR